MVNTSPVLDAKSNKTVVIKMFLISRSKKPADTRNRAVGVAVTGGGAPQKVVRQKRADPQERRAAADVHTGAPQTHGVLRHRARASRLL